ncbi:hypothetical protein BDR22DRAFT_475181 [Usnea florida]
MRLSLEIMIPFAIIPLAYSRWGRSRSENRSLATGWRPIGWPHILGGTPANTSICRYPAQWDGKMWWIMCSAALALIVLYGVLAFAMWGIMSVDLPRLIVWNRTGEEWRRNFAGRVLKVRGRPNWMLCSLVVVSVAIGEILPLLFGHLFSGNSSGSFIMTNLVIIFSQVGPTFVMPVFHLEVIGRITWFIRLIMIFSAPAAVFPAWGLRRIKQWRKRGQPVHLEGLLPPNELIEFIRLHERSQGFGGMVEDHVGKAARNLLEQQISREDPSNGDLSSTHIGTEGTEPGQLTESIRSTVNQSLHEEESRTPDIESNPRPISIRSHCQEGSTAIEDAQVTGLRKREERSTEGHEPIITVTGVKWAAIAAGFCSSGS